MKISTTNTELFEETAKKLGLTFKRIPTKKNRSLFYITGNGRFYYGSAKSPGFYPKAHRSGAFLTGNKQLTDIALTELGFKTIPSFFLNPLNHRSFTAFFNYANEQVSQFPVIIKPCYGLDGRGIKFVTNVTTLKKILREIYKNDTLVVMQEILQEPEYRILVVNNKVELVHSKDFRVITGNGTDNINSLLTSITDRDKSQEFIETQYNVTGYDKKTILKSGENFGYHVVKNSSARHYQTSKFPKDLVLWTKKLTTGLNIPTMGIDLFVSGSLSDSNNYTIIELNSNPGLGHYYKACGDSTQPERICEKVLRDYFNIKK